MRAHINRSKKKRKFLRETPMCLLCEKESTSLAVNKFCSCITVPEHYVNIPGGRLLRPELKKTIKRKVLLACP